MTPHRQYARYLITFCISALWLLFHSLAAPAQAQGSGRQPVRLIVPPSPPPAGYTPSRLVQRALPGDIMLTNVPAYSWCYGFGHQRKRHVRCGHR